MFCAGIFAQTHGAVPLDSAVYYILEQAELKGWCAPLPGVRPYTRAAVLSVINDILGSRYAEELSAGERAALQNFSDRFAAPDAGADLIRGGYYAQTSINNGGIPVSLDVTGRLYAEFSGSLYAGTDEKYWGTEIWVRLAAAGDISRYFSYMFAGEGGLTAAPRKFQGTAFAYYDGYPNADANPQIPSYGQPLTHFPYAYQKRWDGSIYFFNAISIFNPWPDELAGGYNLVSEFSASFWENKLFLRLGRLPREWSSVPQGASLVLNKSARPFLGAEVAFNPLSWFGFSSLTGILEYYNSEDIKTSAETFQNAYSISMLQFNYKKYITLDIGEAVVWVKRFELGYPSFITNSFFYQNNIGDFDNLAMFTTLKARAPGIGAVWFSLFLDEAYLKSDAGELDRTMLAMQGGLNVPLPFGAYTSLLFSYTSINPYCYTHTRIKTPWAESDKMETAYVNNGTGIGYYLPPNSDEFLVRLKTMPLASLVTAFTYQLVRHGADYGSGAVDGSSLSSELDPGGRNENPVLRRYFLHDGAYQWTHAIKAEASWSPDKTPFSFFCEAGVVLSYFTNTEESANSGALHQYSVIDTQEYPKSTAFILKLGITTFKN